MATAPATKSKETYKERIKRLSQRIVEGQRPIRILDAIKWPQHVLQEFRASKFREVPTLGPDDYAARDLGYDLVAKQAEFREIISSIERDLGKEDDIGRLLISIAEQYHDAVEMLKQRGKKEFWTYSRKLYGSPQDRFFNDRSTISDLGQMLYGILSKLENVPLGKPIVEDLSAEKAVSMLNERLSEYFHDDEVHAKLSDGIIADAAAGGDTVKIKSDAVFSRRDIDILEVHEGWVHIGTTLNGGAQHVARWLSKGPPRVAATQEGLAVIMEIFTFRSFPRRAKQINDRILGIEKVECGANVVELFDFYLTEGYTEEESLSNVMRVFRGGLPGGGAPFTKDISYCRGFIENYNFMRSAIRAGRPQLLPFLFVGKLAVDDVPLLYQKHQEGLIDAPKYLPPHFRDLNGVAVWMSFSNFLNVVDLGAVQEHYEQLFRKHL